MRAKSLSGYQPVSSMLETLEMVSILNAALEITRSPPARLEEILYRVD